MFPAFSKCGGPTLRCMGASRMSQWLHSLAVPSPPSPSPPSYVLSGRGVGMTARYKRPAFPLLQHQANILRPTMQRPEAEGEGSGATGGEGTAGETQTEVDRPCEWCCVWTAPLCVGEVALKKRTRAQRCFDSNRSTCDRSLAWRRSGVRK